MSYHFLKYSNENKLNRNFDKGDKYSIKFYQKY